MVKTGKRIPISDVKEVGKKNGYTHVIVFAYDAETGTQSVATWGQSVAQCEESADLGNKIKRGLGWPEDQCHAKPKRNKKPVDS